MAKIFAGRRVVVFTGVKFGRQLTFPSKHFPDCDFIEVGCEFMQTSNISWRKTLCVWRESAIVERNPIPGQSSVFVAAKAAS